MYSHVGGVDFGKIKINFFSFFFLFFVCKSRLNLYPPFPLYIFIGPMEAEINARAMQVQKALEAAEQRVVTETDRVAALQKMIDDLEKDIRRLDDSAEKLAKGLILKRQEQQLAQLKLGLSVVKGVRDNAQGGVDAVEFERNELAARKKLYEESTSDPSFSAPVRFTDFVPLDNSKQWPLPDGTELVRFFFSFFLFFFFFI